MEADGDVVMSDVEKCEHCRQWGNSGGRLLESAFGNLLNYAATRSPRVARSAACSAKRSTKRSGVSCALSTTSSLRSIRDVARINTKLLHPPLSPSSQVTKISLRIVTSPVSQRKPKVACVFPCLNYTFVIGRLIEESLCGECRYLLCSCKKRRCLNEGHTLIYCLAHIMYCARSSGVASSGTRINEGAAFSSVTTDRTR
jgi:hypothetical protein